MFKAGLIISSALLAAFLIYNFLGDIAEKVRDYYKKKREEEGKKKEKKDILTILYYEPGSAPAKMVKGGLAFAFFILMQMSVGKIVFSIIAAIFAFNLPGIIAKKKFKKQATLFNEQLLDSLGALMNSLQAGASLAQGLQIMVEESEPPLSEQFAEVLQKVRLGVPLNKALDELDARMGNKDLHLAVLAMNVTREYGGNLSEILKRISEVMRERSRIEKKIDSITAQGRLSGWIITFIPFFLIVVLNFMQPELFGLMFTTTLGNIMLGFAVLLVAIGNIVIQKIVQINI